MEVDSDGELNITMTATVPLGLQACIDLRFEYDHAVSGVHKSDCAAYFREGHLQHTLKVRVQPTFGCNSYSSLLNFKPYDGPGAHLTMWKDYAPSNIKVR